MYEVTYSVDGIIYKTNIEASNYSQVFNIITNMYGSGNIQIINIMTRRV